MFLTKKLSKVLKRTTVILLVFVFSLFGIVACGDNEKATNPTSSDSGTFIPEPGYTGPVNSDIPSWETNYSSSIDTIPIPIPEPEPEPEPEPPKPTFPEDTYYKIYAPWVKWDESQAPNGWRTNVSWQDTDTLTKIWKDQIDGGKRNNGARWFIKDSGNKYSDHRYGNYYYFDKDFNMVYYRNKSSLTLRKFRCGIIVKYNAGRNAGTWTIGGLYETVLTKDEITGNNFDTLNMFMGTSYMGDRSRGCLEILTMNTGYDDWHQNEFGADFYFATSGGKESWYNIEQYTNKNPEALNNFLNVKRNLAGIRDWTYKFVDNRPYDWHLMDHLQYSGWH